MASLTSKVKSSDPILPGVLIRLESLRSLSPYSANSHPLPFQLNAQRRYHDHDSWHCEEESKNSTIQLSTHLE
jgi:hypothetical protein